VVIGFRGKSGAKVRDMAAVQRYLEALRSTKGGSPSPASSPPSSPRPLRSQSPVETNKYSLNKWTRVFNTIEKVHGYVSPGGKHIVYHTPLKRGENGYPYDDYENAKEADSDGNRDELEIGPNEQYRPQYRPKALGGKRKTKKQARRRKKTRRH
jgi:hypothetical protein